MARLAQDATRQVPRLNFVNEYHSARRFEIGLFMKTNIAVTRQLYENPRGPLTVAEASSFKP